MKHRGRQTDAVGVVRASAAASAFHGKFVYTVSVDEMTGKPNALCDHKLNKTQSYKNKLKLCRYSAPNINYGFLMHAQ